jgi:hypothetical protein
MADWYAIKPEDFRNIGGNWLLIQYYGGYLAQALEAVIPEYDWQLWRFEHIAQEHLMQFWQDIYKQRQFFDWLGEVMTVRNLKDWYEIEGSIVEEKGAKSLLEFFYGGSYLYALKTIFPELRELRLYEKRVPHGYWFNKKHQRDFFDDLAKEIGLKSPRDWYHVKLARERGPLRHHFNGSLATALLQVYPEYNWQLWRFDKAPNGFWKEKGNIMDYLEWLAEVLNIHKKEDWYSVSCEQILSLKGKTLMQTHGGLIPLLGRLFPDQFTRTPAPIFSKIQMHLFKALQILFPGEPIKLNFRDSGLNFSATKNSMELDVFLPSLQLALEYQGNCAL